MKSDDIIKRSEEKELPSVFENVTLSGLSTFFLQATVADYYQTMFVVLVIDVSLWGQEKGDLRWGYDDVMIALFDNTTKGETKCRLKWQGYPKSKKAQLSGSLEWLYKTATRSIFATFRWGWRPPVDKKAVAVCELFPKPHTWYPYGNITASYSVLPLKDINPFKKNHDTEHNPTNNFNRLIGKLVGNIQLQGHLGKSWGKKETPTHWPNVLHLCTWFWEEALNLGIRKSTWNSFFFC